MLGARVGAGAGAGFSAALAEITALGSGRGSCGVASGLAGTGFSASSPNRSKVSGGVVITLGSFERFGNAAYAAKGRARAIVSVPNLSAPTARVAYRRPHSRAVWPA